MVIGSMPITCVTAQFQLVVLQMRRKELPDHHTVAHGVLGRN